MFVSAPALVLWGLSWLGLAVALILMLFMNNFLITQNKKLIFHMGEMTVRLDQASKQIQAVMATHVLLSKENERLRKK